MKIDSGFNFDFDRDCATKQGLLETVERWTQCTTRLLKVLRFKQDEWDYTDVVLELQLARLQASLQYIAQNVDSRHKYMRPLVFRTASEGMSLFGRIIIRSIDSIAESLELVESVMPEKNSTERRDRFWETNLSLKSKAQQAMWDQPFGLVISRTGSMTNSSFSLSGGRFITCSDTTPPR